MIIGIVMASKEQTMPGRPKTADTVSTNANNGEIAMARTVRFIIGSLDVGGTEKHLALILPRLKSPEFIPVVITLTHKGELAMQLEQAGIKVYQPPAVLRRLQKTPVIKILFGPYIRLWYLIYMFLKIPARLTCFYLPAAYHLGGIAALITGDSGKTAMFRRSLNQYQVKWYVISFIERFLHKQQRAIIGNSQAVIRELVENEGVPTDKVTLIYNGIEVSRFGNTEKREEIRLALGLGADEIVLCIVANLIPYKGHTDLIDALISIRNKIQRPWKLLCVGSGIEKRGDLIGKVEAGDLTGHVKWLGRQDDIPGILSAADIGLLVSHQEGFSNAVLEGMAAGLPMIVTDVGGNTEAIEHQKCGLVVKPHDPTDLGEAILYYINDMDRARSYGQAARQRVQQYFSIQACVDSYKSLFDSIMDK
jgi:glycosyltransferase involved in cell wall biosynthesis